MILRKFISLEINPTPPFDFDSTFHKPDHFTSCDNYWEKGIRWQTWLWEGKKLGLKFINKGSVRKPLMAVDVYSKVKLTKPYVESLTNEITYRYNLNLDLTDFNDKFKNNEILGPIINNLYGMRPGHPSSLYEYLIIGIVLQNATIKRSVQMFENLHKKYGKKLEFDGKTLWCFWEPGSLCRVPEQELRNLKVGYRSKSIKRIDDEFKTGNINEIELRKKDRETQKEELLKLYGVGPATVWYLLFDIFHHWDFFNHISPWEQKIYSKMFFNADPEKPVSTKKLLKHFENYGEYKQLAVHYIWEDLWWKRKYENIPWLEKLIRI